MPEKAQKFFYTYWSQSSENQHVFLITWAKGRTDCAGYWNTQLLYSSVFVYTDPPNWYYHKYLTPVRYGREVNELLYLKGHEVVQWQN